MMDLTAYDVAAMARAEKLIREELARGFIKSRREAAAFHTKVIAQVIADDVLLGLDQYAPRLLEYRYLRDLTADLYSDAADNLARIDRQSGTGWPS